MGSVTARLKAIETQQPVPEKRINALCCMIGDIEREIQSNLADCPAEAKMVHRLYRGVIDNTVDIVCRQPKCNNYLKEYKIIKAPDFDGMIAILLRIVFSLDSGE